MSESSSWYSVHPHVSLPSSVVFCHNHIWLQWEICGRSELRNELKERQFCFSMHLRQGGECDVGALTPLSINIVLYWPNFRFIQPTRLSYGKVLFFTVREAKIPINIGELIISSLDALFLALFYVVSDLTFAWPSNIDFRTALSLLVRWCWALWRKSIADIMTSNVLAWIEWRGMSPLFI